MQKQLRCVCKTIFLDWNVKQAMITKKITGGLDHIEPQLIGIIF